jgi:pimeloyl-ACP methyl ester carboxylesterase
MSGSEHALKHHMNDSVRSTHMSMKTNVLERVEDDMIERRIADPDATLEKAPTRYVEVNGIRFAYRQLGPKTGTPLVLLQHFSGNIDAWDPAVVNALATDRSVIAFDNAGVGRSTGQTPDSVAAMARDAVNFINALGLTEVDLLGFSLGGCVAQQIAAEHGGLVRKLILVGTAPKGGEEHLIAVLQDAFSQTAAPDPRLPLFFTNSAASQSAGLAFLQRTKARTEDRDPDNGSAVTNPQAKALITWCATPDPEHAVLRAITQPALVVSGSHDTMLPAQNAYAMFMALPNAQLVLYPDSGHGALFQYPDLFVSHVRIFLDA